MNYKEILRGKIKLFEDLEVGSSFVCQEMQLLLAIIRLEVTKNMEHWNKMLR